MQKDFIPGDEWMYFKLYTGVKTADTLLVEFLGATVDKLLNEKAIDKWFFIRYSDPDFHLRFRLKLTDISNLSKVILYVNEAIKPFMKNNMVSNFQIEKYSRELDRYGYKTINEAEELFYYDSVMTIQMLKEIEGDQGEKFRWHFACLAVDYLLSDFGLDENEKLKLIDNLQNGFGLEFGMNTQLKIQLDDKFREERKQMRSFLLRTNTIYNIFYEILEQKSNKNKASIDRINILRNNKELEVDFDSLISSFTHMMLNRIFKSKQRLNEMVIYSLLYRFYKSEMARNKKLQTV